VLTPTPDGPLEVFEVRRGRRVVARVEVTHGHLVTMTGPEGEGLAELSETQEELVEIAVRAALEVRPPGPVWTLGGLQIVPLKSGADAAEKQAGRQPAPGDPRP
jgi:hypothetical protein